MEDHSPQSQHTQVNHLPPTRRAAFGVAFAVQALAVLVIVFGDIGFDKPGRYGLDFGHLLLLVVIWFLASGTGFMLAWGARRSWMFRLQCLVFGLVVLGALAVAYWPMSRQPVPPDAVEYRVPDGK